MTRRLGWTFLISAGITTVAVAQTVPFRGGDADAFGPEVGYVHAGILRGSEGVVSPDRKYVSIGIRPTANRLLGLDESDFKRGTGMGVVARVDKPGHAPSVLDREGITLVDP